MPKHPIVGDLSDPSCPVCYTRLGRNAPLRTFSCKNPDCNFSVTDRELSNAEAKAQGVPPPVVGSDGSGEKKSALALTSSQRCAIVDNLLASYSEDVAKAGDIDDKIKRKTMAKQKALHEWTEFRLRVQRCRSGLTSEQVANEIREALDNDYWPFIKELGDLYKKLRCSELEKTHKSDVQANKLAMPRTFPESLPKGFPVLFGDLHGELLPEDARYIEYKSKLPGYEHQACQAYKLPNGKEVPAEYIDWRAWCQTRKDNAK